MPIFSAATRKRYLLGLGIIAVLALAQFVVLHARIAEAQQQSEILARAGRQAALEEQIVGIATELIAVRAGDDPNELRTDLVSAADRLERNQLDLAAPSSPANASAWPPAKVRALYDSPPFDIVRETRRFAGHARALASAPRIGLNFANLDYRAISDMHDGLRYSYERAVAEYVDEGGRERDTYFAFSGIGLFVAVVTLLAEIAFIFLPMERAIVSRERSLLQRVDDLRESERSQREALERLRSSEANLARAQRAARMGSWIFDLTTRELTWSDELYRLAGLEPAAVRPSIDSLLAICHPDDVGAVRRAIRESSVTSTPFALEARYVRADGEIRWGRQLGEYDRDAAGKAQRLVGIIVDISDGKAAEERLAFQADHDALTGLPNRTALGVRLAEAVAQAVAQEKIVATLFVDIDDFKRINDTLGHAVGDDLIRQVAQRLSRCARTGDIVARTGGDEFVIALTDLSDADEVIRRVESLMRDASVPYVLGGTEFVVALSVGVTLAPEDASLPADLLRNADTAMYQAKAAGGNDFRFFTPLMHARAVSRLALETQLRHALQHEEFVLYYQPIVATSGRVVAMEALVRWQHPTAGLIAPDAFLPMMEADGTIVALGEWVLRTACAHARALQRMGGPPIRTSVNLSARQLSSPGLVASVARTICEAKVDPASIELELTESAVMADVDRAIETMHELSALGIRLGIDDFGTGYSSMAYLKNIPAKTVKIDRTFVHGLPNDRGDAAIVRAVITLAHHLELTVVAEGVETLAQADFLRAAHCDALQGFLFSKPLPFEQLAPFVLAQLPRTARRANLSSA